MGSNLYWIIVTLGIASAAQLTDAACGELTACTTHENCPAEKACVGEEGNKFCRGCNCEQKSQCVQQGQGTTCNCDGYALKGPRCDCEIQSSKDMDCNNYTEYFLVISGYKIKNIQPTTTSTSAVNQCIKLCKMDPTCFAFYQYHEYYYDTCYLYSEPADKNILFNSVVKVQSLMYKVAFRKCEIFG
ncbi:uncharacterized protein LOC132738559 [Ruditapes philippinarum]|uniref:uncharacterized protein LOC132738559 n=1 Tax=Ruditapes philippinarum TaxID=129788 RepID=UPI00295ABB57|nr:uncharacterized protein LOC132738559 [Ruditapes philippinarum]